MNGPIGIDDRRAAFVALAAAGVVWGLTVPLSKLALGWLAPAWLAALRFGAAAPVLAVLGRRGLRAAARPSIAGWGAIGFGGVIALQNAGIARTSVTHAALIVGAVPAVVAGLTALRGRGSAGLGAWSGFAVAIAGVVLVAGSGGEASLRGDVLVAVASLLSAATIVAQQGLLEGRDPVAVTAVQMTAAALLALVVAAVLGPPVTGSASGPAVLSTVGLATGGTLLPFTLYAWGQTRVAAEVAGAFVNLEPLVGALVGALVLHDRFGGTQALGAAAVLAGLALSVDLPRPRLRGRRRIDSPSAC